MDDEPFGEQIYDMTSGRSMGKSEYVVLRAIKENGTLMVMTQAGKERAIAIAKKHGLEPPKIYVCGKEGEQDAT